jgi:UDPglucose 6-dehydrogenase
MKKIAIIGTGYVGIVTGSCLSESGNKVICVDIDQNKVEMMKKGISPIYEPGLEDILKRNLDSGRIQFTTNLKEAIDSSWCVFLCLPTPSDEDGSADLSYVLKVAEDIAEIISISGDRELLVINKSTVPVGTSTKVLDKFTKRELKKVVVASNPEFLREGFAVEDFMKPDRVVVGTTNEWAKKSLTKLYEPFTRSGNPIIIMDEASAELTKYAANSFLAVKISYINEISRLCEKLGANVDDVRRGIGTDERIGKRFLFPGIGYGGSCFMPNETLQFVVGDSYKKISFETLWEELKNEDFQKTENFELLNLETKDFSVLGFDFKNFVLQNQNIYYLTRRSYTEKVVKFETRDGHKQMLTLDHPIIYNSDENIPTLMLAHNLSVGTKIFTYDENKLPYEIDLDEVISKEIIDSPFPMVYSIETENETVVTEFGIVSHNCFPKDVRAILKTSEDYGIDLSIIKSAMLTNHTQRELFIHTIENKLNELGIEENAKIGIWGISFKPNTDDIREAPSIDIIRHLLTKNHSISAYDPEASNTGFENNPNFNRTNTYLQAVNEVDVLVICTEWTEFRGIDFDELLSTMKGKTIIDGRNLWDVKEMIGKGFNYISIGRSEIKNPQ